MIADLLVAVGLVAAGYGWGWWRRGVVSDRRRARVRAVSDRATQERIKELVPAQTRRAD